MCRKSLSRQPAPLLLVLSLIFGYAGVTRAADNFVPSSRQLTMTSVAIGTATFTDMVVTVGAIVSGPTGSSAYTSADTYDPVSGHLSVPAVNVDGKAFYNVVVTVQGLVSVGAVTGADIYDGNHLLVNYAKVGNVIYNHAVVTAGPVVSAAGGMPLDVKDTYSAASGHLSIPAVQFGTHVYTNVVVKVDSIQSVGGGGGFACNSAGKTPAGGSSAGAATTETPLYFFGASATDAKSPYSGLIEGSDGNLYGTTYFGGTNGVGAVYKVTKAGVESVLYSFSGSFSASSADGAGSKAGIVQACDGNFYGTTVAGGAHNGGVIYKVTPAGVESIVYSFGAGGTSDLTGPGAALIVGWDGNLYGTTQGGGAYAQGGIFRVTPAGVETVLYSYRNLGTDGSPFGDSALVQGSDGNFYGVTPGGGRYSNGTLFRMSPAGQVSVLYNFAGQPSDGSAPLAALIQASDGNFYGTTSSGGANNGGTAFRFTLSGAESVLYSFGPLFGASAGDASDPHSALVQASDGNLYGVSALGGANSNGAFFRLSLAGAETLLYSFAGGKTDGDFPVGIIQASDGNFYGTTLLGGPNANPPVATSDGSLFRLTHVIGGVP
jgi:uncharacterized repeat protein (TIGR03803 family)